MVKKIEEDPDIIENLPVGKQYIDETDENIFYTIELEDKGEEAILKSNGTAGNITDTVEVVLEKHIENDSVELVPDMALFAEEKITIRNTGIIKGDIISNASKKGAIKIDNSGGNFIEKIILKDTVDSDVIENNYAKNLNIEYTSQIKNYATTEMPEIPKGNSNKDLITTWWPAMEPINMIDEDILFFNNINLTGPPLTIKVGDGHKTIVANNLITNSGNSNLTIEGSGSLTIHVKNNLDLSSAGNFNWDGSPDKLRIYHHGTNRITMTGGNCKIKGIIQTASSPITITGSAKFVGHIISNTSEKVNIYHSGVPGLEGILYAPDASVVISNGGKVLGSVIAKEAEIFEHGTIEFNENIGPISLPVQNGGGSNISYKKIQYK